ncbi:MAG: DMT family transporter [Clostridia bacterium]|nr:DMT family transporter [Clostridia bacterium]
MRNERRAAMAQLIASMTIFGTIGVFVRYVPLPSAAIAFVRGLIGCLCLLILVYMKGDRIDGTAVRRHLPVLVLSGAAIGFNWILLFEAYRYTTVATATMCYYFAPVLVIAASPLVGERLTRRKLLCILVSLAGMVFVSGMAEGGLPGAGELRGVLLGLGAAALYASSMLMNRRLTTLRAYDKTIFQLGAATIVILPYMLMTGGFGGAAMTGRTLLLLAVVGVIHTGVAYACYFGCMKSLRAQTVAIFSYLDPVVAIILSATILREAVSPLALTGAALILGSAIVSELPE